MFSLQTTPYGPGRVRGAIRHGRAAATRDGLVVLSQHELANFEGPCSGLIVVDGRPFSQSMVRVLGYGMPTVIVTPDQATQLQEGIELVLDGASGMLFAPELLDSMPVAELIEPAELFSALKTADQQSITLHATTNNRVGLMRSLSSGARGITLKMELIGSKARTAPTAEFFITEMGICGHEAEPLPLTICLPDITAEKLPLWCVDKVDQLSGTATRGVRLYNEEPFRSTVFAMLEGVVEASEYYDIRVMLPYVTHLEEYHTWRALIDAACPVPITLGVAIETPAAALLVVELLDAADFVVLNTDELAESLFAAQGNGSHWVEPYAPALFRLLQQIARLAAHRVGEIQLSGQLSRMPGVLSVLIGMGYRIFAADPLYVTRLGQAIPTINSELAAGLAEAVCCASDIRSVKQALNIQ